MRPGAVGSDAVQSPEFRRGPGDEGGDVIQPRSPSAQRAAKPQTINRSMSHQPRAEALRAKNSRSPQALTAPVVKASKLVGANPDLQASFNGLNHRDQRTANGGNQFSLEPPDQGFCVGNGYVLESVNDVLRVFDTAGNPLIGVVDLNSFYGYAAQINRTTGAQGPFVTDPSCYFDPDVRRWFQVVLTLDVVPDTGDFTGTTISISPSAKLPARWASGTSIAWRARTMAPTARPITSATLGLARSWQQSECLLRRFPAYWCRRQRLLRHDK